MIRTIKIIFLAILVNLMFINTLFVLASDEETFNLSLGKVIEYNQEQIGDILYERFEIDGYDGIKRVAFNAAFDNNSSSIDMVVWDNYIDSDHYRKATVMDIAKNFEEVTGRKVYAAVNGDFFIMSYPEEKYVGKTTHTYMKDGEEIVYGWDPKLANFGFNNQGEYKIQSGVLTLNTIKHKVLRIYLDDKNYQEFDIDKFDQMALKGEIGVYTPQSKQINGTFTGKYIAKVKDNNYDFPIEATIVRDDNQELLTNDLIDIPLGHIGLAVNSFGEYINGESQFFYDALQNGQKIEIVEKENYTNPGFENLNYVIGGMNRLVINREITPDGTSVAVDPNNRHPRTTMGVTVDGKFFIQVIDGRQDGYSLGVTTLEQAQLAYDLGAIDAMELDGGGSSTFILRVNDDLQVVNQPSNTDMALRPVANAILFVEGINGSELPEEVPNCDAYSHLEACNTDTEEPVDVPEDETSKSNNNIYIISAIGTAVIITVIGVIIKKKK